MDTETTGATALQIEGLEVRFGDVRAVAGLSLRVPSGCLFGLLGPNGAGKTTTIRCLAGLQVPTAAACLRVGEVDVLAQPSAVAHQIGVVPQRLALYEDLSVRQNLRIFGGLFGLAGQRLRERVGWGLALAQLEGRAAARVGTLSGGMKRRLNLAASLLHDPQLILCDEPTTGVDPQSRNHLFDTIRALHAEGRTIVYTTHYMEEVEALCERVAIIDKGRVLVDDRLDNLLAGDAEPTSFEVELAAGSEPGAVESALRAAGLRVSRTRARQQSLEHVFLELTGRALRDGS